MSKLTNPDFPEELLDPTIVGEDRRNLVDNYKYWRDEAIKADLDTRRHDFAVVLENFAYDFNIATAVRNANAFLAAEVLICGRRKWDHRGAIGTHHYQHVSQYSDWDQLVPYLQENDYVPIVFDNIDGAVSLFEFEWPQRPAMIFGQESIGVSPQSLQAAAEVVYIPQFGSTRSINVGTASGIAMYDYLQKLHR